MWGDEESTSNDWSIPYNSDAQSGPLNALEYGEAALPSGSLNDWGSWAQGIGKTIITGAVDTYRYRTIADNGGIPEVGQNGQLYTVGTRAPVQRPAVQVGGLSISPMLLLAGVGLVAFILVSGK